MFFSKTGFVSCEWLKRRKSTSSALQPNDGYYSWRWKVGSKGRCVQAFFMFPWQPVNDDELLTVSTQTTAGIHHISPIINVSYFCKYSVGVKRWFLAKLLKAISEKCCCTGWRVCLPWCSQELHLSANNRPLKMFTCVCDIFRFYSLTMNQRTNE